MTSIRYGLVFSLCLAIAATCAARDDAVARKAAPVGGTGMSASKSLVDNFAAAKDLKTFSDALKSGGLTDTLEGPGPFTVFAPTDAAFKKLPEGTVVNLKADENKPQLVAVLTYHIVPGGFSTKDLAEKIKDGGGKAELKTIQGEKLTVQMKGKTIEIVDGKGDTAHVTVPNVAQANGIVHVIDAVLLP